HRLPRARRGRQPHPGGVRRPVPHDRPGRPRAHLPAAVSAEPTPTADGALEYGTLTWVPALQRPDLLAEPVRVALGPLPRAGEVHVVEIDPELADTAAMTEAYDLPAEASVNCVLVAGKRAGEERVAACAVRATTRADVNSTVRRLLDVRKASFWPTDRAVEASGMEYGGITPV